MDKEKCDKCGKPMPIQEHDDWDGLCLNCSFEVNTNELGE